MTEAVRIDRVRKDFGSFTALHDVSLGIGDNEFFTLLGPSGCGKTTLLRMIAGFESTTAGAIFLYGDEIENLPPDRRPVNTVFQNYALFPHMSVAENIGFGLKMLRWPKAEAAARVAEMVALVKLEAFADRHPAQLSGGQQQRVALARAMAPKPKVLLLDEPLSALDLKLRQAMRAELKSLQRETAITFVFVTHDQEEALTMSDRIAVMSAGRVQQVGTPTEIYDAPANRFVADFIGETNLIEAVATQSGNTAMPFRLPGGQTVVLRPPAPVRGGTHGTLSLRPERIGFADSGLTGVVTDTTYLGTDTVLAVDLGGLVVNVRRGNGQGVLPAVGDRVHLAIAPDAARFMVD